MIYSGSCGEQVVQFVQSMLVFVLPLSDKKKYKFTLISIVNQAAYIVGLAGNRGCCEEDHDRQSTSTNHPL